MRRRSGRGWPNSRRLGSVNGVQGSGTVAEDSAKEPLAAPLGRGPLPVGPVRPGKCTMLATSGGQGKLSTVPGAGSRAVSPTAHPRGKLPRIIATPAANFGHYRLRGRPRPHRGTAPGLGPVRLAAPMRTGCRTPRGAGCRDVYGRPIRRLLSHLRRRDARAHSTHRWLSHLREPGIPKTGCSYSTLLAGPGCQRVSSTLGWVPTSAM